MFILEKFFYFRKIKLQCPNTVQYRACSPGQLVINKTQIIYFAPFHRTTNIAVTGLMVPLLVDCNKLVVSVSPIDGAKLNLANGLCFVWHISVSLRFSLETRLAVAHVGSTHENLVQKLFRKIRRSPQPPGG